MKYDLRKKPKQERSQSVFQAILEGTEKLIDQFDYKKISMRKISETSGVAIGSIYQYFPNKESIFLQLVELMIAQTRKEFVDRLEELQEDPPQVKFNIMMDHLFRRFENKRKHFRAFIKVISYLNAYDIILQSRQIVVDMSSDALVKQFGHPSEEAQKRSYILINAFIGIMHTHMLEDPPRHRDKELLESMKRILYPIIEPPNHNQQ